MKTAKDSQFIKFNTNWKNIKTLSSKRNSFQKVELQKKKEKKRNGIQYSIMIQGNKHKK